MTNSRRKFKLVDRLATVGGVMDIPHLQFLRYVTLKELVQTHKDDWGQEPESICIPVTASDGLNLYVEGSGLPLAPSIGTERNSTEFAKVIREAVDQKLGIYLLLDPTLNFVTADALHIRDIVGDPSSAICIANPRSQELLGAILGSAVDEVLQVAHDAPGTLRGVVIDTVNLWPMGAENNRIRLTCFCSSCESFFRARAPKLLDEFKTFPNPWNLLLQDSGTGISHIHDISESSTEEHILGLSRQRGYTDVFKDFTESQLRLQATHALSYVSWRNKLTLASIGSIFNEALHEIEEPISRIVLCQGFTYDWTSGIFLRSLDEAPDSIVSEVWFDPQESDLYLEKKPFRSYMWRRSRYYIDAFLTFAANVASSEMRATTGIARLGKELARETLRRRFAQAIGSGLREKSALASLPALAAPKEASKRIGFVGVAMNSLVGAKFIDGIDIPDGIVGSGKSDKNLFMSKLQDLLGDTGDA